MSVKMKELLRMLQLWCYGFPRYIHISVDPLTPTVVICATIKHPVPDWVKP